ncbi:MULTISPECIES: hypothetical protein [Sphingomonadaceae]|uniref:hypothetical protein n=1 Tax=Sphingomonadaceae TaxID=41297 RepID=UPI001158E9C2|nr:MULTISPECIES: hypothetical protein [Sphingomonadaceae]QDK32892.1 hypothetical protein DM450_08940 [Sphingomonas sp. IC081]QSR18342.1 hypothetical protein CA833_14275 [Novosphingobium sp. KA1]
MRRAVLFALAGASLAFGASPVLAAARPVAKATAPAARPAAPAAGAHTAPPPEVEHAMFYLKVLISGLQSDQVEQPVKGVLVGCLYNNSLSRISTAMDKVIAENPAKVHRDKPNEVLTAMVAICNHPAQGGASQPAKGR